MKKVNAINIDVVCSLGIFDVNKALLRKVAESYDVCMESQLMLFDAVA